MKIKKQDGKFYVQIGDSSHWLEYATLDEAFKTIRTEFGK